MGRSRWAEGRIVDFENLNQKLMSVFGNLANTTSLFLVPSEIIFKMLIDNYQKSNFQLFSFKTKKLAVFFYI